MLVVRQQTNDPYGPHLIVSLKALVHQVENLAAAGVTGKLSSAMIMNYFLITIGRYCTCRQLSSRNHGGRSQDSMFAF
jgi:hypothetical protein